MSSTSSNGLSGIRGSPVVRSSVPRAEAAARRWNRVRGWKPEQLSVQLRAGGLRTGAVDVGAVARHLVARSGLAHVELPVEGKHVEQNVEASVAVDEGTACPDPNGAALVLANREDSEPL